MSSSYSVIWLDRRLRIYHFAPASLPPIGSLVEVCDQVELQTSRRGWTFCSDIMGLMRLK